MATTAVTRRNPARTRARILKAAVDEFCRHGFSGARVERIARRAGFNPRMLYHYFGGKEKLYLAVLESAYARIRGEEAQLELSHLDPLEGMVTLVDFTFSHFLRNPDFITLIANENMLRGKFLRRLPHIPEMTLPLVTAIRGLLERGERQGIFRPGVDPVQLYVTITALGFLHVSNRYTLSTMFGQDLADPAWLEARRTHAREVVLRYLCADPEVAEAAAAQGPTRGDEKGVK